MDTTSGFLACTVAATGAAVTQDLAHGAEGAQLHRTLPGGLSRSNHFCSKKGMVHPAALDAVVDAYEPREIAPGSSLELGARMRERKETWTEAYLKPRTANSLN
jgi:hypothetical protein